MIKQGRSEDDFLEWLHVLTLMDDTLILATSRQTLIKKHTLKHTAVSMAEMKAKQIHGNYGL